MDQLHYERCALCNVQHWEHEGLHQMMEPFDTPDGKYQHYICKPCLRELRDNYLKTQEDNTNEES